MKRIVCVLSAALMAAPVAARADPVPSSVAAMIAVAVKDSNAAELKAVVDAAKKANPHSAHAIDALVKRLQAAATARHVAELRHRSFFENWEGQGEVGASNSTGNTRSTGLSLGLSLTRNGLLWKHSFDAEADYNRSNGAVDKERYFTSWESDYKLTERLYSLGVLSWESDRFSGFTSRLSESLGVGYSVVQTPDMTLSFEGGPAVRQTYYVIGRGENRFAGRAAINYRWAILPHLVLTETASVYADGADNTATSDAALTTSLIGALSVRLGYHVQYESNPPDALETTDTTSRLTLVYAF